MADGRAARAFWPRKLDRSAPLALAPLLVSLLCAPGAAHADPVPISQAETMLFMAPHLQDVKTPSRLHYAFRRSGTLEKGFSDTVDVDVTSGADGKKKAAVRSHSSAGETSSPELEQTDTNPVLLFYLNREIAEMRRLTRGSTFHFSKQIRIALAESAQIKDIDVQFGGRTLRARQITILPYKSDPYSDRYPDQRLMAKQYVFTICDQIPGRIYQVRGLVPAAGDAPAEAVLDETLTFTSAGAPTNGAPH
jgi:hypothetical protein